MTWADGGGGTPSLYRCTYPRRVWPAQPVLKSLAMSYKGGWVTSLFFHSRFICSKCVCFTSHLVQPKTTLFAEPCISALYGVIPIWWGFQVSFRENIKKLLAVFSPDKYRQIWNDKIFCLCKAFFVLSDHVGNRVTLRNRSYCLEFSNPASDHLTALWLLWGVPHLSLLACS